MSKILLAIQSNKKFLDKVTEIKLSDFLGDKLNIKNVLCCYKLAKHFNISSFYESTFNYIERWFTSVIKTKNFLVLEFSDLMKILVSSGLLITSELEVYEAAEKWIGCDIKERKKFAIDLLFTVRLSLLSDLTLKKLLEKLSSFTKVDKSKETLRKVLKCKRKFYENMSSTYTTTRYCNQKFMKILVCGGIELRSDMPLRTINQVDVSNFKVNVFPAMVFGRYSFQVVFLRGNIYVFGGCHPNDFCIRSIMKYSLMGKRWNEVAIIPVNLEEYFMPDSFCACAFIDKVFIFGGLCPYYGFASNGFLQFDTNNFEFKIMAGMIEARKRAACAVFEEKLVVSGGLVNNRNSLNTVECYDVTGDVSWTRMPSMTKGRYEHSLVVVRNKLIVIGRGSNACEVYTTNTGKFVALKSPVLTYNRSLQVAGKIFVFQEKKAYVWVYDVEGDYWKKKECDATKNIVYFSCAKMPIY